jgi:hypothetical protein
MTRLVTLRAVREYAEDPDHIVFDADSLYEDFDGIRW